MDLLSTIDPNKLFVIMIAGYKSASLNSLCWQECKVQNMIREYCKIFAAEARVIENFGFSLE